MRREHKQRSIGTVIPVSNDADSPVIRASLGSVTILSGNTEALVNGGKILAVLCFVISNYLWPLVLFVPLAFLLGFMVQRAFWHHVLIVTARSLVVEKRVFWLLSRTTIPLESVSSVVVTKGRMHTSLEFVQSNGMMHRIRLGPEADHRAVALWVNGLLHAVDGEELLAELIPRDLQRLRLLRAKATFAGLGVIHDPV